MRNFPISEKKSKFARNFRTKTATYKLWTFQLLVLSKYMYPSRSWTYPWSMFVFSSSFKQIKAYSKISIRASWEILYNFLNPNLEILFGKEIWVWLNYFEKPFSIDLFTFGKRFSVLIVIFEKTPLSWPLRNPTTWPWK